jgi:TolB-like protein/Tfp pilus assembly protein PilF
LAGVSRFLGELKRRNVIRVTVAYVAGSWLLIQVADVVFPLYGFDDAVITTMITILAIGLPLVAVFSWVYQLTPEGLMLDKEVDHSVAALRPASKTVDRIIIVALSLALGFFAVDKFVLDPSRDAAKVETAAEAAVEQVLSELQSREASPNSIAVLPFLDISPNRDQEYFSDGITDELLGLLSRSTDLRVTSRTSAFAFKGQNLPVSQIAERLNVSYVLEGSIRMSGDEVRITAQLVDAGDDVQLWSESYDRRLEDIFAIHSEIAARVIEELRGRLGAISPEPQPEQPTENLEAYTLYLKGRYFWNRRTAEDIDKALGFFQRAAAMDPGYALAHAGIADVWIFRGWYSVLAPKETFPKAKAAIANALAHDDRLAAAYASRAHVKLEFDHEWESAELDYQKAIALDPGYSIAHHWYGGFLSAMGRHEEALQQAHTARELDPLSMIVNTWVGLRHYFARRYDVALEEYRKALELNPDFAPLQWHMGWALEQTGRYEEALQAARNAIELSADNPLYVASLGHTYAVAGERARSREVLERLVGEAGRRHVSAYHVAVIHGALGDTDQAMHWLQLAFDERSPWIGYMAVDPRLDPLRGDPRLEQLIRAVGLD